MDYPKVNVLVLSYNGKYLLDDCLSSYLGNHYPNFQVTVIDNGSHDGTYDYVKEHFPKAEVIRIEKNAGYSGGFNAGLWHAFRDQKADFVLVSNNDVKADGDAISALVEVAQLDEKNGFVTGKVYYFDRPDILQTVGKKDDPIRWNGGQIGRNEKDNGQYEQVMERPFADDIFTLVSRKLYEKTGGYDPTFFLQCEEYDWQARAKNAGFRIVYTPKAKLWHKVSMTIGKASPLKAYYDTRNPMIVIMKYKSPDYFRRYFWLHVRSDVIKTSLRLILRTFELKKVLKIWLGLFSGIYWGIRNKKLTLKHVIKY